MKFIPLIRSTKIHFINSKLLIFCFLFLSLLEPIHSKTKTSSSRKNKAKKANPVLAVVNNKKITLKEFSKKYKEIKEEAFLVPSPEKFLEDLINYEIGVQEARKRKFNQSPLIKERMNQEIYKFFVEKSIGKKVENIKVSENEMLNYYKKNPLIHTRHILVEVPPEPNAKHLSEAKARAKKICAKIKDPQSDFQKAAKLYSDDPLTKFSGGDLGFRSRFTFSHMPNFYNKAIKMKKGEIQCLVKTKYGYHTIKLINKMPYSRANKNQIKASVFDEKRAKIFLTFFKKLQSKHNIKKNLALIKKIQ